MPETRKSPLAYGWQLLRRWPWLSLIPLVISAMSLFFPNEADPAELRLTLSFHTPLPVLGDLNVTGAPLINHWFFNLLFMVVATFITAGFIYVLLQGLRGERPTFSLFLDGVWEHGPRLLGAWLLFLLASLLLGLTGLITPFIAIVGLGAFALFGQLWQYTMIIEELGPWPALRQAISRFINKFGLFFAPLALGFLLNLAFGSLATAPAAWRLPFALALYPFLGSLLSASVVAAYLQALDQEPQVGGGDGPVPLLKVALLTLGVVALVWPFATGLFRHYRALLPGHEPVMVLEGYQYKTDPSGPWVKTTGPNANLVFDQFDGRVGQGWIYVEDQPPIFFTVRVSLGPLIRGWVEEPLLGYTGKVGNRLHMQMSADQRIFTLAEQPYDDVGNPDYVFADVGATYAVSQYPNSVGYYFAAELPSHQELRTMLKAAVPWPAQLWEPNLWPLRVGAALAQNSSAALLELLEEEEGDWPEKHLIYELFNSVEADAPAVMQVRPVLDGAGLTRTFSGSVIRSSGEEWRFSGAVTNTDDGWRLVELELPVLRKD